MNCKASSRSLSARRASAGFTLAEVLAAMLFLAIVLPVAVAGLRIAATAGEVGVRKEVAGRIAENLLNEMVITGQTQSSSLSGVIEKRGREYKWMIKIDPTSLEDLRLATVWVGFPVQGQTYDVRLSTLVDASQ